MRAYCSRAGVRFLAVPRASPISGLRPILAVEVEGRRDDVAGMFVAQLDDVFAEIGFDRGDTVRFQVIIDPDLLRDHGFAFCHGLRAGLLADF